jgi:hypothetical protein
MRWLAIRFWDLIIRVGLLLLALGMSRLERIPVSSQPVREYTPTLTEAWIASLLDANDLETGIFLADPKVAAVQSQTSTVFSTQRETRES